MKRMLLILSVICLLLGGFAGCGKEPGDSSTPAPSGNSTTAGTSTAAADADANTTIIAGTTTTMDAGTTEGSASSTTGKPTTSKPVDKKTTKKTTSSTTKKATSTTVAKEENAMDAAIGAYLNRPSNVKYIAAYDPDSNGGKSGNDWANIKAITYDGATKSGKKTKVFAYIGFPEGASKTNKVPAVVLVHGGGGHAFAEWIKLWTDRGYAAIAMDTTGFFPSKSGKGLAGHESDAQTLWNYGLYGDFIEDGYVNVPNNDNVSTSAQALDQQWMYHAVISTIMGHNVLREDERVDSSKIGYCGISWGGIIGAIAIGYDTRYAYAIPIYGTAFLDESLGYQGDIFSEPNTKKIWSAADRLDRVDFPVMWLGWASDTPFSINAASKSFTATKSAGTVLNMREPWGHSHGMGWNPEDIILFADSIIGKTAKFTAVIKQPTVEKLENGKYSVSVTIDPADNATKVSAAAMYLTQKLSYSKVNDWRQTVMDQTWKYQAATVKDNVITVTLPASAKEFYIHITTTTPDGKYTVSTEFIRGLK